MKLRSFSPLPSGIEVEGRLTTDHPMSSYGQKVLVLETGEALGTGDVSLAWIPMEDEEPNGFSAQHGEEASFGRSYVKAIRNL